MYDNKNDRRPITIKCKTFKCWLTRHMIKFLWENEFITLKEYYRILVRTKQRMTLKKRPMGKADIPDDKYKTQKFLMERCSKEEVLDAWGNDIFPIDMDLLNEYYSRGRHT